MIFVVLFEITSSKRAIFLKDTFIFSRALPLAPNWTLNTALNLNLTYFNPLIEYFRINPISPTFPLILSTENFSVLFQNPHNDRRLFITISFDRDSVLSNDQVFYSPGWKSFLYFFPFSFSCYSEAKVQKPPPTAGCALCHCATRVPKQIKFMFSLALAAAENFPKGGGRKPRKKTENFRIALKKRCFLCVMFWD